MSEAQAPFQAFLRTYAETSIQRRSILDSSEYESKRMVNSAFSLTEVWRRLVASGQHHVMRHQRRDCPSQAETWRLRWISKNEGSREGPAYRIVKVRNLLVSFVIPIRPQRPANLPFSAVGIRRVSS